ncbi:MAG: membrane protein insertion efficiency factor YidD [Nitrospirae bacterium]|nr:membrane protein insertion efficiency factor YidD [Nitrospirota bacterium]MBI3393855.1 membrane protein insertion efficiency factor YidD [Nitrospirota bacterium]
MRSGTWFRPRAGEPLLILRESVLCLIRIYQRFVSPMVGPSCRHIPSCSRYASQAVQEHGVMRGMALATWRLLRCHPFGRGGYDPVPRR